MRLAEVERLFVTVFRRLATQVKRLSIGTRYPEAGRIETRIVKGSREAERLGGINCLYRMYETWHPNQSVRRSGMGRAEILSAVCSEFWVDVASGPHEQGDSHP
jgi:hypothetical protein